MAQYGKIEFDFDHWSELAEKDPDAFEERRSAVIRQTIEQAPAPMRRRLQGIQWQVDNIRERSNNPMAACLKISNLMWKSVLEKDGLLDSLNSLGNTTLGNPDSPLRTRKPPATVLTFDRPRPELDD